MQRTLSGIALGVALLLAGSSWWRLRALERATMTGWRAALDGGVVTTRATIDDWYTERTDDAVALAENLSRHAGTISEPSGIAAVRMLLDASRRRGHYVGAWVLGADGAVIASATEDTLYAPERATSEKARTRGAPMVSPVTLDANAFSTMAFAAAVPAAAVPMAPGTVRPAVVVLRVDVVKAFAPWAKGRANSALSVLVSPDMPGAVLVRACPDRNPPVCVSRGSSLLPGSAEQLALSGVDTFGVFPTTGGHDDLASTRYDSLYGWGIVRRIGIADAFVPYRKEVAIEGGALLLVLAILALGAYATNRTARVRLLHEQREADARLATAVDASTDGLLSMNASFVITMANAAVERLFDAPRESLPGRRVTELFAPEWRDALDERLRAFERSDDSHAYIRNSERTLGQRANGSTFPIEATLGRAVLDGVPLYTMGVHDVSDRVRSEAFVQGQRAVLELIASGAPALRSLQALARLVMSEAPTMRCAFYELDDDALIARLLCAPQLYPDTHRAGDALEGLYALDEFMIGTSAGVVGAALYANEAVYSIDAAIDPVWVERRDFVQKHGIRAAWAVPLHAAHGNVIGAFACYYDQPRGPTPRERELARAAVHLSSIALSSARDAASLRASEASFRSFVENAPAAIFRETRRGHLVSANPAMIALLGYPTSEALVQAADVGLLYHEHAARETLLHALDHQDVVRGEELDWRRADGSRVTVRLSARAYRDDRGAVWLFEGFAEDVTTLRAVEEALRQSAKLAAVGQLISGVAHELNNPLSSILHFAEDLLADERTTEDAEALGVIRDQARRSRAIVRDLLSFVHGRDEPVEKLVLATVVAETARAIRPLASAAGTQLHVDVSGGATVLGDRAGLEQVITNLLTNAVQAAGEGGEVWVRTEHDATNCHVAVEDSGPGIPAHVLPRIFEPFFTTKATGEGTGLGLSVSLGIVEQFGGRIAVSPRDGDRRGTRFVVSIPCAGTAGSNAVRAVRESMTTGEMRRAVVENREGSMASADQDSGDRETTGRQAKAPVARVAPEGARSPIQQSPGERRALIIDDEPTIRAALRRYFTRRAWQVEEASDGGAALELLAEHAERFTVIVSDLRMPGFSGVELHDRLAQEQPELLSRMIFSTGDVASEEAANFVRRTICPVLQKPFELRTLDDMVGRLIEGAGAPPTVV